MPDMFYIHRGYNFDTLSTQETRQVCHRRVALLQALEANEHHARLLHMPEQQKADLKGIEERVDHAVTKTSPATQPPTWHRSLESSRSQIAITWLHMAASLPTYPRR